MEEKKLLVTEIVNYDKNIPLQIPCELMVLLWKEDSLIGLYLKLVYLSQTKMIGFLSQPVLANCLGLNYRTFLIRRKKLEELMLLKVLITNNNNIKLILNTEGLVGLLKNYRESLKKQHTPRCCSNIKILEEYLETTRIFLLEQLKNKPKEKITQDIYYINNTNNINTNSNSNSNSTNTQAKEKKMVQRFPKENYEIVIQAYQKYKGVKLFGPEVLQAYRAIKTMFRSNRKPKEIIDFMKWLNENEDNTPWIKTWTLWTVQKKMPEFLAGKLLVEKEQEYEKL